MSGSSFSSQAMYAKRHRLRKLRGETAYVDAGPSRLHIATLTGAGWSLRSIAGTSGVPVTTVSRVMSGEQRSVAPTTQTRLLAVSPQTIADRTDTPGAEPFVARIGTTRRIQALLFMGWGHEQMREHTGGINTAALLHQQGRWVTRSTHDKVAAMYRVLSHRRGPSSKATSWARKLGYAGPLDWDDIDRDTAPSGEEPERGPAG